MTRSRWAILITAIILGTIGYYSFFTVKIGEQVVVKRFGKIVRIEKSGGLEFKLPFDQIDRYYPNQIQRMEIGFRSDPTQKTFSDRDSNPQLWEMKHQSITKNTEESLVITRDENIVDVNCVVHYQINDLRSYLTNIDSPRVFLQNISEAAIRAAFGKETLVRILVENKFKLQSELREYIQIHLDKQHAGIHITKVGLQDVHPPVEVVLSFRDVTSAREDKNTLIYTAQEYKERQLPKARGEAFGGIQNADATGQELILKSLGDKLRYLPLAGLAKKYKKELAYKNFYDFIGKTYTKSRLYILSHDLFNDLEIIQSKSTPTKNELIEESDY